MKKWILSLVLTNLMGTLAHAASLQDEFQSRLAETEQAKQSLECKTSLAPELQRMGYELIAELVAVSGSALTGQAADIEGAPQDKNWMWTLTARLEDGQICSFTFENNYPHADDPQAHVRTSKAECVTADNVLKVLPKLQKAFASPCLP